jgi:hypothetical protein
MADGAPEDNIPENRKYGGVFRRDNGWLFTLRPLANNQPWNVVAATATGAALSSAEASIAVAAQSALASLSIGSPGS